MENVTEITHFGNFLRWQMDRFKGPAGFFAAKGYPVSSMERHFRVKSSKDFTMRQYDRDDFAIALGYSSWIELDKAWKAEPKPPYPKKNAAPAPARAPVDGDLSLENQPKQNVDVLKRGNFEHHVDIPAILAAIAKMDDIDALNAIAAAAQGRLREIQPDVAGKIEPPAGFERAGPRAARRTPGKGK